VRVLLVDNDPDFCALLRVLLPAAVEVVGEAHDGFRAIELARETAPDAILMDFHMPLMDGVATTLQIRSFLPDVRVIVLPGLSTYEVVRTDTLVLTQSAIARIEDYAA